MIRHAEDKDLNTIMNIYETARKYMQDNGNPTQWGASHPSRELLECDIKEQNLYICTENEIIHGVFAFIIGEDPTYLKIEKGAWINGQPYGTIHRIAADGIVKGIFSQSVTYCKKQIDNLRIDTHLDNHTMQYLIKKNGFEECGIIYTEDGSPRIAYQYVKN